MYKGIPMEKLTGQTVPGFRDSLVGCGPFADAGLVTILHPHQGGVTIHRESDIEIRFSAPPLIQGYREADGNRMWRIRPPTHYGNDSKGKRRRNNHVQFGDTTATA